MTVRIPAITASSHTSMPGRKTFSERTTSITAAVTKFKTHHRYTLAFVISAVKPPQIPSKTNKASNTQKKEWDVSSDASAKNVQDSVRNTTKSISSTPRG